MPWFSLCGVLFQCFGGESKYFVNAGGLCGPVPKIFLFRRFRKSVGRGNCLYVRPDGTERRPADGFS
jgi:hypothetical protein